MKKIFVVFALLLIVGVKVIDASEEFIDIRFIELKNHSRDNNVSIIKHKSVDIDDFTDGYRGDFAIYKVNNEYTFCVEPLTNTYSSAQKIEYEQTDYYKFDDLTKEKISEIALISEQLYAYYKNDEYLYAGQLLIWDTIKPNVFDTNVEEFKDEINEINNFQKELQNIGSSLVLQYNKEKNRYEAIIKNKFLTSPIFSEVVEVSTDLEYIKGTNKITIFSNDFFNTTKKITFNILKEDEVIYYNAGQELKKFSYDYSSFQMNVNMEEGYGGFKLKKVGEQVLDDNVILDGIKFKVTGITDTSFEKIYTTANNGMIVVLNNKLPIGEYKIEEVDSNGIFQMDFYEEFSINTGQITNINQGNEIVNELKTTNIYFYKYGENEITNNDNYIKLEGVEFNLYKDVNENKKFDLNIDKLVKSSTSDEDGLVVFNDVKYDQYLIMESDNSNDNYIISDEVKYLDLTKYNGGDKYYLNEEYNYYNDYKKGNLTFTKIGIKNGEYNNLEDSIFVLYQDVNKNQTLDASDVKISEVTSDINGEVVFSNLKYGHYIVKEMKASEGYLLNDDEIIVEIDKENNRINEDNEFLNEYEYNELILEKIDLDSGEHLDGAEFYIYEINDYGEEILFINEKEYKVNRILMNQSIITKGGVFTVTDLLPGEYIVKEVAAPYGYKLNEENIKYINLPYDEGALVFENEQIYVDVIINKVDESTNKKLEGAELEIKDMKGNVIESFVSTKKDDKLSLPYGKYDLCEIKAPEGYEKETECMKFIVEEETREIEFTNRQITIKNIANSGFNNNIIPIFVSGFIIVILVVIRNIKFK